MLSLFQMNQMNCYNNNMYRIQKCEGNYSKKSTEKIHFITQAHLMHTRTWSVIKKIGRIFSGCINVKKIHYHLWWNRSLSEQNARGLGEDIPTLLQGLRDLRAFAGIPRDGEGVGDAYKCPSWVLVARLQWNDLYLYSREIITQSSSPTRTPENVRGMTTSIHIDPRIDSDDTENSHGNANPPSNRHWSCYGQGLNSGPGRNDRPSSGPLPCSAFSLIQQMNRVRGVGRS